MNWEKSINNFKSYLKIERSLSENSIQAYIRDINKLANYSIKIEIKPLKISRNNISNFLQELFSVIQYFLLFIFFLNNIRNFHHMKRTLNL